MQTRWQYQDARGVTHIGFYERCIDRGGTDVTYYMRDENTNELTLLSGQRLRDAKVLR